MYSYNAIYFKGSYNAMNKDMGVMSEDKLCWCGPLEVI